MVLGVGVDVLAVQRMRHALREDAGLRAAVFTPREIAECEASPDAACAYAIRFAAKEAVLKGLSVRPPDTGVFRDIEIGAVGGAPTVALRGRLGGRFAGAADLRPHLSLAHTHDHAIATVVVERIARAV
jgi:holo-[acyl-carrier protein] synthase